MTEQEQAEHLLAAVHHRLSGPEIESLERIIECGGIPEIWDEEQHEYFYDTDTENALTRLCTEFAETFK